MGRHLPEPAVPQGRPPASRPAPARQGDTLWKVRFPGVRILLPKKDIKDAFRWIAVNEADACIFGADLDGKEWNIPATVVAIYWVLTFGWTGSPGEWMVWAWLVKSYHAAFKPTDPS